MTKRRGSFNSASARDWMEGVFDQWIALGNTLEELVVVCDNAPCHSGLDSLFAASPATLLRLGPYSPMLNPVETIWSKIKTKVKSSIRIPHVEPPGVGEQRLAYMERAIDEAIPTITNGDCARSVQHTSSFHADVLALQDMRPGI